MFIHYFVSFLMAASTNLTPSSSPKSSMNIGSVGATALIAVVCFVFCRRICSPLQSNFLSTGYITGQENYWAHINRAAGLQHPSVHSRYCLQSWRNTFSVFLFLSFWRRSWWLQYVWQPTIPRLHCGAQGAATNIPIRMLIPQRSMRIWMRFSHLWTQISPQMASLLQYKTNLARRILSMVLQFVGNI